MDRFFFFFSVLKGWTKQKKQKLLYLFTDINYRCVWRIKSVQGREEEDKKTIKKKKKEKNVRNELHIYIPENIDTK